MFGSNISGIISPYVCSGYSSYSTNSLTLSPTLINECSSGDGYCSASFNAGFWTFLNKDRCELTVVLRCVGTGITGLQCLETCNINQLDFYNFVSNYSGICTVGYGADAGCFNTVRHLRISNTNRANGGTTGFYCGNCNQYACTPTTVVSGCENNFCFNDIYSSAVCFMTLPQGLPDCINVCVDPMQQSFVNPIFKQCSGVISCCVGVSCAYISKTVSYIPTTGAGGYGCIPSSNNYCSILKTVEKSLNEKCIIRCFPYDIKMSNLSLQPKAHADFYVNPTGGGIPQPLLQINFFQVPMWNVSPYVNSDNLVSDNVIDIKLPAAKVDKNGRALRRYVRVTRLSHETLSTLISKKISLSKVTEVIPQRFSYPFSAIVGTKIDSRAFAQIPTRTFDCKLKKVLVPSNYFPFDDQGNDIRYSSGSGVYRVYDGDWDGTFKLMWTNNPAWVLMDLLINKRYGLGNYIESEQVDIWELYKIARWCDGVDERGYYYGVTSSEGGVEPRHTFNGVIQDKFNVFDMVTQVASVFRGHVYYMNSMITFDDDRVKPVIGEFNNSDVKDGLFSYTNLQKDQEFTATEVAFMDSFDNFKPKIEYIEDTEAIRKRGILKKSINAYGVTSRGQARRLGRHFLYQTAKENMNVAFVTDSRALLYRPGDLISINDELINTVRNFGSVKKIENLNSDSFKIVIDKTLDSGIYETGEISLYAPVSKPNPEEMFILSQQVPKSVSMCIPLPLDGMTYLDSVSGVAGGACNASYCCCFYTGAPATGSMNDPRSYYCYTVTYNGTGYLKPNGFTNKLAQVNLFPNFDDNPSHYGAYSFTGCVSIPNVCYVYGITQNITPVLCGSVATGLYVQLVCGSPFYTCKTLCCPSTNSLSVLMQYVKGCDLNGCLSSYGHWEMRTGTGSISTSNFCCTSNVAVLDVSNTELKFSLAHRPYYFEYFDTGKFLQLTGLVSGTPLYFDATSNVQNCIDCAALGTGVHPAFNYPHTYVSQAKIGCATKFSCIGNTIDSCGYINMSSPVCTFGFSVSSYNSSALKYSDVIESDRPSIETFYITGFSTGAYVNEFTKCQNEYSELYITKSGRALSTSAFSGIKESVESGISNLITGSSYSLKVRNVVKPTFKIMSITENYINEYSILSAQYRPEKFKEIEENTTVDSLADTFNFLSAYNSATSTNSAGSLSAPVISSFGIVAYMNGSVMQARWVPVDGATKYHVFIKTPSKQTKNTAVEISGSSLDEDSGEFVYNFTLPKDNVEVGTYTVYIEAFSETTGNSMYKFSPQASRSASVLTY